MEGSETWSGPIVRVGGSHALRGVGVEGDTRAVAEQRRLRVTGIRLHHDRICSIRQIAINVKNSDI